MRSGGSVVYLSISYRTVSKYRLSEIYRISNTFRWRFRYRYRYDNIVQFDTIYNTSIYRPSYTDIHPYVLLLGARWLITPNVSLFRSLYVLYNQDILSWGLVTPVLHLRRKKVFADSLNKPTTGSTSNLCMFLQDVQYFCHNASHTVDPKTHHPAMDSWGALTTVWQSDRSFRTLQGPRHCR